MNNEHGDTNSSSDVNLYAMHSKCVIVWEELSSEVQNQEIKSSGIHT
jgi:hypothetical protein